MTSPTAVVSRGVTLVELMATLVVLGLLAGISGIALVSLRPTPEAAAFGALVQTRATAIRTGLPVMVGDTVHDTTWGSTLFLPDGRAVGPGVDPLTGAIRGTR